MKKQIFFCCVFILFFVLVIVSGCFLLRPIAKVGNDTVRTYEFIKYSLSDKAQVLERMADDMTMERIIEETGVTVSNEEVVNELDALKNYSDISYQTCLNTILRQKATNKYASEYQVSAEEARRYYENNKLQYGDEEPDFEKVKADIQLEMGVAKYEERLYKIREECKVSIVE